MANKALRVCLVCAFLAALLGCSSGTDVSRSAINAELPDASDSYSPPHSEDVRPDLPHDISKPDAGGDGDAEETQLTDVGDAAADVDDVSGVDGDGETDTATPSIPCPGACTGHGTCDTKTGICSCSKAFDGAACEKCKIEYEMYPICKPVCKLLSHTYTETPPASFDTVELEGVIKTVPVHCSEHPECIGGFSEETDFASLTFAPGCTSGKFVYKGKRHFNCVGKLIPPAAAQVILRLNGALNWMCPESSVVYLPTGDITITCEVNPKTFGLSPPYSIKPYLKLMSSKGFWNGMEMGPPSPFCIPPP